MKRFLIITSLLLPAIVHADTPPALLEAVKANVSQPVNSTTTAWATGLRAPMGMARDASGNLYVAEYNGGQISKFSPDGKLLGKIGSEMKSPAWLERVGDTIYVSERKENRILKLGADGALTPVGGEIIEPLGIAAYPNGDLLVVAHTTSRLFRFPEPGAAQPQNAEEVYNAPTEQGRRYGLRAATVDRDGTAYVTDEVEGTVLLITPQGRVAVWAKGLDDPTAVVVAPDGQIYVAEEGAGRVSRLSAEGVPTVVAEGLGQARDIEFLDAKTMLVSDRQSGTIWKVELGG